MHGRPLKGQQQDRRLSTYVVRPEKQIPAPTASNFESETTLMHVKSSQQKWRDLALLNIPRTFSHQRDALSPSATQPANTESTGPGL